MNNGAYEKIYKSETLENYKNCELSTTNKKSQLHFEIRVEYTGFTKEELINTAETAIDNTPNPKVAAMCAVTGLTIGASNKYVSDIFHIHDVENLQLGESIIIVSPTGSGKSEAIERNVKPILDKKKVVVLTNRKINETQLLKEFRDKLGLCDLPDSLLEKMTMHMNLEVMTYQKFIMHANRYNGKELLLVLDECHSISEDSVFSLYGQKMLQFLHNNLDNTSRIYITATPYDVLDIIWKLEALSEYEISDITYKTSLSNLVENRKKFKTRIKHFFMMKPNWDYIQFKAYSPDDIEELQKYLNLANDNGEKAFIFVNDKEKGRSLQEVLQSSQHVYSGEDKKDEIMQLALEYSFRSDALIATKVAENGFSLHDEKLNLIVAETWDLITLQQVIGRARVSRKNPRKIEVLIPDYSLSELNQIE